MISQRQCKDLESDVVSDCRIAIIIQGLPLPSYLQVGDRQHVWLVLVLPRNGNPEQ